MAVYPAPPAHRFAWDRDGSVGFYNNSTQMSAQQMKDINDETTSGMNVTAGSWTGVVFPELRDIAGVFQANQDAGNFAFETSTNTTNGADGTWVAQGTIASVPAVTPAYRSSITSKSITGIKGVRTSCGGNQYGCSFYALHVYGSRPSTGDRLALYHGSLNIELTGADFDYGDMTQGTTNSSKAFRIANLSSTKTAGNVVVSIDTLSDTSPTQASMFSFSTNGGTTFSSTVTITSIAPGAISSGVIIRRALPNNATAGPWAPRLVVAPTTFA